MKSKLPNIVLIVLDTLGAKHMSLYGYHRKNTPNLERLAEEFTVYTRCFAPSCWTIPSHASIFTGLYPSQHGAYDGKFTLNDNVQHLVPVLKGMGYRTMGISSNGLISPDSGICRGFDYYKDFGHVAFNKWVSQLSGLHSGIDELTALLDQRTTKEKFKRYFKYILETQKLNIALKKAVETIKCRVKNRINPAPDVKSSKYTENTVKITRDIIGSQENNAPLFLFINLMENHDFFCPPLRWRQFSRWHDKQKYRPTELYMQETVRPIDTLEQVYRNLYDDEIYYVDDVMNRIWDIIKSSPNPDDTLFIITSDHGEHLGEKALYGHLLSLYNDLIWVPLIIKFPKDINKRGKEDRLVSLNDLYATILDLVQSPFPCPETSVSLLRNHERDVTLSQHIYPEIFRTTLGAKQEVCRLKGETFSPAVWAVMTSSGLKAIENRDGVIEIYNLQKDAEENHNLAPTMPAEALENIRHMIKSLKEETSYQAALDEASKLKIPTGLVGV